MRVTGIFLVKEFQKELNSGYIQEIATALKAQGFDILAIGRAGISVTVDKQILENFLGFEVFLKKEGQVFEISKEDKTLSKIAKLLIASSLDYY